MRKLILLLGLSLSLSLQAATTHYVDINCTNPVAPYLTWATAATNIQDAVDTISSSDLVLVTNGVYRTGGKLFAGVTNRVYFFRITLRSVNGPEVTIIEGQPDPVATNGPNAVRCVLLGSGASLIGFTLTNGASSIPDNNNANFGYGGGILFTDPSSSVSDCIIVGNSAKYGGGVSAIPSGGSVSNCIITGNRAQFYGGGSAFVSLRNCIISNNVAIGLGGGAFQATLDHCIVSYNRTTNSSLGGGGGLNGCTANNCVISYNVATSRGGGAFDCNLNNCLVLSNSVAGIGGGVYGYGVANCTIIGNSAGKGGGFDVHDVVGPGVKCVNSIVYFNTATNNANYSDPFGSGGGYLAFCCSTPLASSTCFTNPPQFVDLDGGDFHLQSNSPCINSGYNGYSTNLLDFDGNPRIAGGTVDVGAYEYPTPSSIISYGWLQDSSLPTDGSADFVDSDGDGASNWQEWIAGTDPVNTNSLLKISAVNISNSNNIITWPAVTNRTYYLQRSTNLTAGTGFLNVKSNLFTYSTNALMASDSASTSTGPFFYRVQVTRDPKTSP